MELRLFWLAGGVVCCLLACSSGDTPRAVDPNVTPAPKPPPTFGDAGVAPQGGCAPSPSNFDIPGNGCDDDGDGLVDNAPACDNGSLPVDGTPMQFANSMALCQSTNGPNDIRWGVISAAYTSGYNAVAAPPAAQHGILGAFGAVVVPREGASLGVLSSGFARPYDTLGTGTDAFKGVKTPMQGGTPDTTPPGYPETKTGCPVLDNAAYDLAALKLVIKVPTNAQGLMFDFDFWSGEWPEYVCTPYNDTFIAYLSSLANPGRMPQNVSFDTSQDTVSVNNGFFDRCTPGAETSCMGMTPKTAACPGGESELGGTGFFDQGVYCGASRSTGGGATGWLTTQAPVVPGEVITLELMIWDTGDPSWDSSVLLDNFRWVAGPVTNTTGRPQ